MEWTIAIAFYLGSACYVAAAAFALWYLRAEGSSRALTAARRALELGATLTIKSDARHVVTFSFLKMGPMKMTMTT